MSSPCHIELILSEKEEPVKKEVCGSLYTVCVHLSNKSVTVVLIWLICLFFRRSLRLQPGRLKEGSSTVLEWVRVDCRLSLPKWKFWLVICRLLYQCTASSYCHLDQCLYCLYNSKLWMKCLWILSIFILMVMSMLVNILINMGFWLWFMLQPCGIMGEISESWLRGRTCEVLGVGVVAEDLCQHAVISSIVVSSKVAIVLLPLSHNISISSYGFRCPGS